MTCPWRYSCDETGTSVGPGGPGRRHGDGCVGLLAPVLDAQEEVDGGAALAV
jgi:hypothetical protein